MSESYVKRPKASRVQGNKKGHFGDTNMVREATIHALYPQHDASVCYIVCSLVIQSEICIENTHHVHRAWISPLPHGGGCSVMRHQG